MKNKENTLGANKQMAFLNTTKLAVALKRALLALVLCTLSMPYANAKKYNYYYYDAQLTVQTKDTAAGKIFVSGTELTPPPSQGQDKASLILQDPNTYSNVTSSGGGMVSFYVYAIPEAGYIFKGWSSSSTIFENIEVNTNKYSIPAGNYNNVTKKDASPYSQSNAGAESFQWWNSYEYYSATNSQTIYAWFETKQTNFNVTFAAAKGGGGYTFQNGTDASIAAAGQTVPLNGTTATTLTAPNSEDYKFWAWYVSYDNGDTFSLLSKSSELTHTFDKPTIVYAQFIPDDAALFIIKNGDGTEYWNLNEACTKAQSSSSKVVLPKDNGTLYPLVNGELCKSIPKDKTAKDYTILSGVTLLVPYNGDHATQTKAQTESSQSANPTCYRTLTIASDVKVIVNSEAKVDVGGILNTGGQTTTAIGAPRAHGKIRMAAGSSITLNEGSHLYCWGYIVGVKNDRGEIIGEGTIIAESGSTVHESLQIRDWKGGTASLPMENNDQRVFPVNQYYIQNVEVPITFKQNAKDLVTTGMRVQIPVLGEQEGKTEDQPFISSGDGLFNLTSADAILVRDYDEKNDRVIYELTGSSFSFDKLNLNLKALGIGIDILSEKYVLPFTNNMTLHIKSGTFNVNNEVFIAPGAELYISEGAIVVANNNVYVLDKDDWVPYKNNNISPLLYANETVYAATASGTKKQYIRKWEDMQDADIYVNGTIQIKKGNLYTSKGKANIHSTKHGKIEYYTSQVDGTMYMVADATNDGKVQSPDDYTSIPITAAQLHNDESKTWNQDEKYKYTPTAGAVANDVFTYSETYGRWRCERTVTWEANGGTIEPLPTIMGKGEPLSLYFPESLPTPTRVGYTFNGWFTAASDGEQITTGTIVNNNVTYYAQWTLNIVGTPLDIVDADGTNLTINTNGWASSIWSYTINETLYEKNARQEDRTLVIPYSGDPNDDMPIVVKNESDEVISNHMYKVPFVYTSDATMSGTNENSIVFVKSGTLSIEGTASAKEIYVAPGAELKVNENSTLNVEKLVLRTTPYKAAILTNNGTINGQVFYSRISPNSEQYYQFGLPLSCELANVKMSNTGKLGGSQPKYGTAWILKSYSESLRANNGISNEGANWSLLPSNGTITAGVGYEMFSNSNYYREFYFPVNLSEATNQVSVQYTGGTIGVEHNGWNIITSPLTSRANVPIIGDPATAIKVCWLNEDGSYRQEQPTVIPPAIPFSYQASAGEDNLNFVVPTIAAAPRKQSAAEALTETEWVHLDILDAYGEGDETSLFVHPTRFEQTYKTGIDMAKQSLTASRAILYTTHAYGDMAFAGVADSLLENGIDLVVYSPSAQELTFSLRENKFLNRLEYLWLADNETGERTDLLMDDYTFRADAGTAKGRFVLNGRFKAPQISTGIGNTQTDYNIYAIGNNIAISGVEQGTPIYVFDAVGHIIYTTAATSDEVIVPAPCAGVYMLSVGGQTAKLVINK